MGPPRQLPRFGEGGRCQEKMTVRAGGFDDDDDDLSGCVFLVLMSYFPWVLFCQIDK